MKLDVIIGYREYLEPTPVSCEELQLFLQRWDRGIEVPLIGWSPRIEHSCYASFATEVASDVARRVALLIEYLQDVSSERDRVALIVPFESYLEHGSCAAGARRVRHFMDAAIDILGERDVRCRALALTHNTQRVLTTLGEMAGALFGSEIAAPDYEITEAIAKDASDGIAELTGMRLNYTRAVLELCAKIVSQSLIFSGPQRVPVLIEHMARNQLFIRPELTAEEILEQLEPGGELYELLSRPLPATATTDEIHDAP